jgi:hypothetical protein
MPGQLTVPRWASAPLVGVGVLLLSVYFGQSVTAPPDFSEGSALAGYAHRLAHGERIHFDLLEYYGPLGWVIPTWAYSLAGDRVIGIHIALAISRVISCILVFHLVRRLTDRLYATLAAGLMAAPLGMKLPFLSAPYAPHFGLVPFLLVAILLSAPPPGRRHLAAAAAGVLTAVLLWMKLSVGAFVLVGGAVGLLGLPLAEAPAPEPSRALIVAKVAVLAAVAIVFHVYIWPHYRWPYVFFLTLPLLLGLGRLAVGIAQAGARGEVRGDLRLVTLYVGGASLAWLVYFVGYFGTDGVVYLREQFATLAALDYVAPFPKLGTRGSFGAFTRWCWPALPVVAAGLFALQLRSPRSEPTPGSVDRENGAVALFLLSAFHTFVIHSRADEAHLFYAALPAIPALVVLLHRVLEGHIHEPHTAWLPRALVVAASVFAMATLFVVPSVDDFRLDRGQWHGSRLEHLRYHSPDFPYPTERDRALAEFDPDLDAAIAALDDLTTDGEVVLVMSPQQILTLGANVQQFGGRYTHALWLIQRGLLRPDAFRRIVPASFLEDLIRDPPRIIVSEKDDSTLYDALPEVRDCAQKHPYAEVAVVSRFTFFARRDTLPPPRGY